ncbi:DUF4231 domain-containing protein [Microbispora sp. ATCC PTA-5024]|uniref:DUF4231 domain-containing protein n=1 Tax=Microbispora sp. ATCC PTA-5024 TaxID=316330 RepID=UPI0003DCBFA1|nr:DUF4231 domain-containing protein [Microbispora sp. ATCC PTA-5024]ETK31612.1 hypothetical protein MPTA5024_33960 [Microbispora sp. ATCC PTA-5024]
METLPDSEFPALYRAADRSAVSGQRRLLSATAVRLSALVVAAACGSFDLVVGSLDAPATVAAAAMAVALVTEVYLLTTRPDRQWYEARSAAESAKTLAWRYLVGGQPFGIGAGEDHEPERLLLRRFSKITGDLRGVSPVPLVDGELQVTEGMRQMRARPLDERKRHYMVGRLNDQRAWYAAKAAIHERKAARWLVTVAVVEALGLMAAAIKAALAGSAPNLDLPGIMGAVAAACVAWLQTRQHQQVAGAYAVAALELGDIVVRADWPTTEPEWAHFVDEAEEAISREHTLWSASHA